MTAECTPINQEVIIGYPQLVFGSDLKDVTPKMVLQSFEQTYNALSSNPGALIIDMFGVDSERAKLSLINHKNIIMRHVVSEQVRTLRYFDIDPPFVNTCIRCHGAGELYEFARKPVKTTCPTCDGNKSIIMPCDKCNDEGRFIQGNKDVSCKYCKGTKQRRVRCINCQGEGTIKKLVMSHVIQSTTPCTHCAGLGFIDTKKENRSREKKIDNPVISQEAYKVLSEVIKES